MTALPAPDCWLKFSAIIPEFSAWLERMAHDSRPVQTSLALERQSYGSHPRQWFEWASTSTAAPLVPVMIHGGYWRALRAEDHRFVLQSLASLGCGVANVEYRLLPETRMEGLSSDVSEALSEIAMRFPDAQLLPIGHSAGAHLALSALQIQPALMRKIRGVVCISGAFDLSLISSSFLQQELKLSRREIARFTIQTPPPVPALFIYGSEETKPFRVQAAKLALKSNRAQTLVVSACHHMNILHGCLHGRAPLVHVLHRWLLGAEIPLTLEVNAS